jgi:hypothetical protein
MAKAIFFTNHMLTIAVNQQSFNKSQSQIYGVDFSFD